MVKRGLWQKRHLFPRLYFLKDSLEYLVTSYSTSRIAVLPDYEGKSDVTHNDLPPNCGEAEGKIQPTLETMNTCSLSKPKAVYHITTMLFHIIFLYIGLWQGRGAGKRCQEEVPGSCQSPNIYININNRVGLNRVGLNKVLLYESAQL